ncbi:50S ribosomal protein L24 [Candidatus Dependentiae bacterium]|jgi:large subunit ribosomal protein L24|nr:50S ribosomal protein L24 [Candidatus Dependentiae bacterium]
MLSRVKKDDTVYVLAGKDKGKHGVVIAVDHKNDRVLIKDVGIVTRHVKARKAGDKSKIVKEESFIPLCKVMPVCSSCKKACRVQVRFLEDSEKVRICHRCKEAF